MNLIIDMSFCKPGFFSSITGCKITCSRRKWPKMTINPFNAVATFVQNTRMQRVFENHLNPVMLIFIG